MKKERGPKRGEEEGESVEEERRGEEERRRRMDWMGLDWKRRSR